MAFYPIEVFEEPYRGVDPKKMREKERLDRLGRQIQNFLNTQFQENGMPDNFEVDYWEIKKAVGGKENEIRNILMRIGGGNNGITIYRKT